MENIYINRSPLNNMDVEIYIFSSTIPEEEGYSLISCIGNTIESRKIISGVNFKMLMNYERFANE